MVEKINVNELESLILARERVDFDALADWAYKTRLDGLGQLGQDILDLLEELGTCNMGPEFEWSKEDLEELLVKLEQ